MISHCDFDLRFPDDYQCWASFYMPVVHLYDLYVFGRMLLYRSSAHFIIRFLFVCLFVFELHELFIYFGY